MTNLPPQSFPNPYYRNYRRLSNSDLAKEIISEIPDKAKAAHITATIREKDLEIGMLKSELAELKDRIEGQKSYIKRIEELYIKLKNKS